MKKPPKKSSFLSESIAFLILFGIAASILDFLAPILPFLIAILIIIAVGYIILILSKKSKNDSTPTSKYSPTPETTSLQVKSIQRQMEILTESTELVNSSNNLDTVLRRYDIVCDTINQLMTYTADEFKAAGFVLKEPLLNTKNELQNNKTPIINQAIERNIEHEINSLKTISGKLKKLDILYDTIKKNTELDATNLSFLEDLYHETQQSLSQENLFTPNSSEVPEILPEIFDLIWFGDGTYKNYTPPVKEAASSDSNIVVFTTVYPNEEPSAIYLELPIIKPSQDTIIESPPYYPSYQGLSSQQRWKYWQFLSDPFSPQSDVGYVFLFYYGLERHMLFGNLDKAFDITLKLRCCYSNSSFQLYTANALYLICMTKRRADLVKKLIDSYEQNHFSTLPPGLLLILKYKFQIPLNASDIIDNHQYFEFTNNRYIKSEPDLFHKVLSEYLIQNFQSDAIDLNKYFPVDIDALPLEQKQIFANRSLSNYKASVPIFQNKKLFSKISALLYDTHETVKRHLRYGNNNDTDDINYVKHIDNLLDTKTFKNMTGHDFEKYCAKLLSLNGFSSITVTRDSGDQGIDIIAYKEDMKYGIQCKLYSNHVGNSAVQEAYSGKDFYKCHVGAVLTNNTFTESAKELADSLGVLLWDGNYLFQLQQNCKK